MLKPSVGTKMKKQNESIEQYSLCTFNKHAQRQYIFLKITYISEILSRYIRVGEYGGNKNGDGFGKEDNNK